MASCLGPPVIPYFEKSLQSYRLYRAYHIIRKGSGSLLTKGGLSPKPIFFRFTPLALTVLLIALFLFHQENYQ